MIELDDRWSIDIDAYNYTLQKKLNSIVKRGGEIVLDENGEPLHQYQSIGYYNTLSNALDAFASMYTRDALMNGGTLTVQEALRLIDKSNREVSDLIGKVTYKK